MPDAANFLIIWILSMRKLGKQFIRTEIGRCIVRQVCVPFQYSIERNVKLGSSKIWLTQTLTLSVANDTINTDVYESDVLPSFLVNHKNLKVNCKFMHISLLLKNLAVNKSSRKYIISNNHGVNYSMISVLLVKCVKIDCFYQFSKFNALIRNVVAAILHSGFKSYC